MMVSGTGLRVILGLAKPLGTASLKKLKKLKPIEQFRIGQAIENAIAEVWDSLDDFFTSEKVGESKRDIVAAACESELRPFAEDVTLLLKNSLDGEKLFEQLRAESPFPQEIREEGLEQIYRIVFPLMASVLCRAPVIVERIDEESLQEVLSRFDELKEQLSNVSVGIAQVRHDPERRADELYSRVLQQALKKVLLGVEVTGLYGDSPRNQAKEEMFVLPAILEVIPKQVDGTTSYVATSSISHSRHFLGKGKRRIIRGAPGAGKSTWSRWLQVHAMREEGILTLYVKLRSCRKDSLPTILDLLSQLVGSNMAEEIDAQAVARWVKLGKIAVLLDGFDEVAPSRREVMVEAVSEMAGYLQDGPCLVTSRPLHSNKPKEDDYLEILGEQWAPWLIQPFDEGRIKDYISRWYRYAPLKEGANRDVDASALFGVLTKDPHVTPLTSNPLMLATLLMVHHNDGELPKGRSKLYDRYIDGMLGIWDDQQEVKADTSGLDREQKKRILTSLAIELHFKNQDEIGEEETEGIIRSALASYGYQADPLQVLESLRERSGLIVGPGSYSFSHKSVGEYLVGKAIYDGDRKVQGEKLDRFLLSRERNNDGWLNVLYFWAGSASVADVQSFIEALGNERDLALWLGLLWDQMDRFQTDWLGTQVRAAVDRVDMIDSTAALLGSSVYICWNFEGIPENSQKASSATKPQIRHVSTERPEDNIIGTLLWKAGFVVGEFADLKNQEWYNSVVFSLARSAPNSVERLSVLAKAERVPIWIRKSLFAWRWFWEEKDLSGDRAITMWEQNFGNEGEPPELWLASAVRQGNFSNVSADLLRRLHELLVCNWSKRSLDLSKNLFAIVPPYNDGDRIDLLKMIADKLEAIDATEELKPTLDLTKLALKKLIEERDT